MTQVSATFPELSAPLAVKKKKKPAWKIGALKALAPLATKALSGA